RLPLTCMTERGRGKNRALNAALPFFAGELIVLTDDDVVPNRDWLVQLQRAANAHPEYSVFGGRILPLWLQEPAPWLLDLIPQGMTYALTPEDQMSGPIAGRNVWGPNMAVRAAVFAPGVRFDEAIGPAEGTYIMGSETEFTTRLERMGHRCWHVRDAV